MRKNRQIRIVSFILAGMIAISGCQKTPDKSAVASKEGGLSQDVIAKPLKEGETRTIELPGQWKASDIRSNDRVTLTVDLPMESVAAGNLPVVEMKNHVLTEKELQNLVDYFAGGEELYVPEVWTKDVYQNNIDRIENGEGAFADASTKMYVKSKGAIKYLEKAKELAPEKQPEPKKTKVTFQEKDMEKSWREAYRYYIDEEELKILEKEFKQESYFLADVGKERSASISAVQYNSDIGKNSKFSWETGAETISEDELNYYMGVLTGMWVHAGTDPDSYQKKEEEMFRQIQDVITGESIDSEEGQKQAERILEDLEQAKTGYRYMFVRAVNGLPVNQMELSMIWNETDGTYATAVSCGKSNC